MKQKLLKLCANILKKYWKQLRIEKVESGYIQRLKEDEPGDELSEEEVNQQVQGYQILPDYITKNVACGVNDGKNFAVLASKHGVPTYKKVISNLPEHIYDKQYGQFSQVRFDEKEKSGYCLFMFWLITRYFQDAFQEGLDVNNTEEFLSIAKDLLERTARVRAKHDHKQYPALHIAVLADNIEQFVQDYKNNWISMKK